MGTHISIFEFILISVGSLLTFVFIKTVIDTLKDKYYGK
jgi:hypothetical protein